MTPLALLGPQPVTDPDLDRVMEELIRRLSGLARNEGTNTEPLLPGLCVHRISQPSSFTKWNTVGPSLIVVAQGRKVATHRGIKLAYDPRRYLVVTGEAEFQGTVLEATPQAPCLSLCLQIPPDLVAKTLLALATPETTPIVEPVPAFIGALDVPITECVVRILRALADPAERAIVLPLALEELVFRLLRTDAASAIRAAVHPDRDADKIHRAMQYLRANLEHAVAVEDVARHVAMSPSHFAHRFRAVARVSPMRYLKGVRLAHARTLLLNDNVRVSEAALRSGYESASHFTRDFKVVYGTTPAEHVRRFHLRQD